MVATHLLCCKTTILCRECFFLFFLISLLICSTTFIFFQRVMEGGSVFKYMNVSKLYPGSPRSMHCHEAYPNVCVCVAVCVGVCS